MNIVILADKFQKRMKSKGCVGLFKIKNKYLIVHQYNTIKKLFPSANIFYIYGFESKKLLNSLSGFMNNIPDISFIYNKHYDSHNYGYSLLLTNQYINDDTIIIFGDSLMNNLTLFDIKDKNSQIIMGNNSNNLGCVITNSKIENIFYDLETQIEEMYFISKKDIGILKEILNTKYLAINNMFIFEIINKMIDKNVIFKPILNNKRNISNRKIKSKNVI